MRKVIVAINTTLDGICNHTAGIPDEEIHDQRSKVCSQHWYPTLVSVEVFYQTTALKHSVLIADKEPTGCNYR